MKKVAVVSLVLFCVFLIVVPVLAIFPLFLFVWSIQSRIQLDLNHFYRKYIALGLLFGLFTEFLAVLDNLDSPPEERILFHPEPATDLLLGIGFYFFIAVVWAILVKRYTFTVKSIFVIGGVWGVVAEQDMAVLLSPLTYGVVSGLFSYVFVFLVYGPFMAIPALFFKESLCTVERKERKFRHAVLAFVLLFGAWVLAAFYMIIMYVVLGLS
ncbi:MAG: hypothetical protein HXS48_15645 [Theionarchaea archaeon]|nr:hypothetical protein [Theionarchaea archaeon]